MNRVITAFKEHKEFSNGKFWDANRLYLNKNISSPPHYADTVEIIVDHGAVGNIHIGGAHYEFSGSGAYFIAPDTVHSMMYKKCDGYVTILKLAVTPLKEFLDISAMIKSNGYGMDDLPHIVPEAANATELEQLFAGSESPFNVLAATLTFFGELSKTASMYLPKMSVQQSADLRRLIKWAEQHCTNKPSLAEAAKIMGYSKNYFCRLFKDATGVTFLDYLNALRIDRACVELKKGMSVSEVCYFCGFESVSYFAKLFKRTVGVTPKKFVSMTELNK